MEVLVDTNVVLDWVLDRVPFNAHAEQVMALCVSGHVSGHLAGHTLLNTFYVARKQLTVDERREILLLLCKRFNVIAVDGPRIVSALNNKDWKDLEDGLQMQCALVEGVDYIVTRDSQGFASSSVPTLSPEEFLKRVKV